MAVPIDDLHERSTLSTKTWWPFDHPPKGTCVPGCRLYGRCHCGCGERPTLSPATFERHARIKGRPYAFRRGHQTRVVIRHGGHWSRRGVAVDKIRPLLAWLHQKHGTWEAVATLLRIPTSTIKGYANNARRRRVPPDAARKIQRLVLAHRNRGSALDRWETEPGFRRHPQMWRSSG